MCTPVPLLHAEMTSQSLPTVSSLRLLFSRRFRFFDDWCLLYRFLCFLLSPQESEKVLQVGPPVRPVMPSFQLLEQTGATFGLQKRHKLVMSRNELRLIRAYVKVEAGVRSQPMR